MGELIASAPVMVIAPRSATPPTTYERLPLDQDAEPPRRGGCATALQLEQQPSSGVSLCCRPCTPSRKRATSAWSSSAGASATSASEAASTQKCHGTQVRSNFLVARRKRPSFLMAHREKPHFIQPLRLEGTSVFSPRCYPPLGAETDGMAC
jgi:hypothetical protein